MIIEMPVSLFENKPERCPFGHDLWPGNAQVSWKPCICGPAREAAERGRGLGHAMVTCNACHDQSRQTRFYEPAHDIGHSGLRLGILVGSPALSASATTARATAVASGSVAAKTLTTQIISSAV